MRQLFHCVKQFLQSNVCCLHSGNLPARLVNRLTASQPQAVAVLRDKLEALYQADVESNGKDMSQIKKEGVDLWVELMKAKEAQNPHREEVGEREEKESLLGWSLVETHYNESLQSSTDMADKLEASNISVSASIVHDTVVQRAYR